jgi:hypothetical protein
MSLARDWTGDRRRPVTKTQAPSTAKARAIALPIPPLAPCILSLRRLFSWTQSTSRLNPSFRKAAPPDGVDQRGADSPHLLLRGDWGPGLRHRSGAGADLLLHRERRDAAIEGDCSGHGAEHRRDADHDEACMEPVEQERTPAIAARRPSPGFERPARWVTAATPTPPPISRIVSTRPEASPAVDRFAPDSAAICMRAPTGRSRCRRARTPGGSRLRSRRRRARASATGPRARAVTTR